MRHFWKVLMGICLVMGGGFMIVSRAWSDDEPVDLSDKQGVVDPADLKKDDPPEPSLHIDEPPAPESNTSDDSSGSGASPYGVPPTSGGIPPGASGASAVIISHGAEPGH